MSDSPPLWALCRQSSPTMSQSSAWKNCLNYFQSGFRAGALVDKIYKTFFFTSVSHGLVT